MKKPIIFFTLIISLIILPYFNLVHADKESFYNQNRIYFLDPNDNCVNSNLVLSSNIEIAKNNQQTLSKKLMKINDPDKFAQAIDIWIEQTTPDSPLKNHGKYAVAGGQRAGINPILPIIIARKESSLATNGQLSKRANNAYGRMATADQPHVGTSRLWYRWNSFQDSLISDDQDDMYQYLARVYQDQQTIDQVMFKYAPPTENNTIKYLSQIKQWANQIYQLAGDSIDISSFGSITNYNYANCNNYNNFNKLDNLTMYYQFDHPWANHSFTSSCGNIKKCGCGPTSIAIVLANLLQDSSINPITISDQMNGMKSAGGTSWSAFDIIPKKYNLSVKALGTNLFHAKEASDKGSLVIMSQAPGKFTTTGHIMVIRGFTPSGNVLVADPNSRQFSNQPNGFSPEIISQSLKGMWAISL